MKTFTIEKENKATRETKPEEKRKQEEEKRIEGLVFDILAARKHIPIRVFEDGAMEE